MMIFIDAGIERIINIIEGTYHRMHGKHGMKSAVAAVTVGDNLRGIYNIEVDVGYRIFHIEMQALPALTGARGGT